MSHKKDQKLQVVALHSRGEGYRAISRVTKLSVSGVQKIINNWKARGTIDRKEGSGRPKTLTEAARRLLLRKAVSNPSLGPVKLGSNFSVSRNTAGRELLKAGFRGKNHCA